MGRWSTTPRSLSRCCRKRYACWRRPSQAAHRLHGCEAVIDISEITEYLYLSAWPRKRDADLLVGLGVRLILAMHWVRPAAALGRPPLRLLWLPTIDSPLVPMPMALLERGVREALPVIERGERVLVHCHFGIHRSVAMACCVLIGMGYSAEDAMALVKNRRALADPRAPYIRKRILLFARSWDGNRAGAHSDDQDIG